MTREEEISSQLLIQFPFLDGHVKIQRARRVWIDSPLEEFDAVFGQLVEKLGFRILCTITGLDEGDSFGVIYHLDREDGTIASLNIKIPKTAARWKSICAMFPGAINYEREIVDLLGVLIEGLPPGSRYPLPDNWPEGQYPLRKDWQGMDSSPKEGGIS